MTRLNALKFRELIEKDTSYLDWFDAWWEGVNFIPVFELPTAQVFYSDLIHSSIYGTYHDLMWVTDQVLASLEVE